MQTKNTLQQALPNLEFSHLLEQEREVVERVYHAMCFKVLRENIIRRLYRFVFTIIITNYKVYTIVGEFFSSVILLATGLIFQQQSVQRLV